MKTLKILIISSVILAFVGCNKNSDSFVSSGAFEANEIVVSAETNGKITEFNIFEGDSISKSQTIGYIDSTQLFLKKMQLIANNRAVISQTPDVDKQTASLKQQIETLETEKARTEKLVNAKVVAQKNLDDIVAQINNLEKQLQAATSNLVKSVVNIDAQSNSIDIQIAQLNDQLDKCKIKSPINGTLIEKYFEEGEFTTVGMPLFKVANLENMILRAYIPYEKLVKIKINQEVSVKIDFGDEKKEYKGKIIWISENAEFTPKTIQTEDQRTNQVYAIKVKVENDGYIKIGMYGEVDL